MRLERLYKITPTLLWACAEREGRVPWAPVDLEDGFVHLSTAAQVRETARRHFEGQRELLLVQVDPSNIPDSRLRWEPSRGGALFPHVYGDIPLTAVTWVKPLPLIDGMHVFPDDVP